LYYYHSDDTASYRAEEEYMWGPSLLVAPVVAKGATSKRIYLPKGEWYNYQTNTKMQGGQWMTDSANLGTITLYAKAGSFIPKNNSRIMNTTKYNSSDISVIYYPSSAYTTYTMYDDDGTTNKAIEKKLFELITFQTDGWGSEAKITIRSNGGKFPGKPPSRMINLQIPGLYQEPSSITLNGKILNEKSWDASKKILSFKFALTDQPMVLNFK
jgi:oligosaccharide 4-alpha-D-glucosyltransferase